MHLRHVDIISSMRWENGNFPLSLDYPAVYAGDFNSHHEDWGYTTAKWWWWNASQLDKWNRSSSNAGFKTEGNFSLCSKEDRLQVYNPDLCWIMTDEEGIPPSYTVEILHIFPVSQQRPSLISLGIQLPITNNCSDTEKGGTSGQQTGRGTQTWLTVPSFAFHILIQ